MPGPPEETPGVPECTAPTGSLEVNDGYGAFALKADLASYVSATFDITSSQYTPPPGQLGFWNFNIPALGHNSGSNTYGARITASKYRNYDYVSAGGYYKGRHDNTLSRLYRSPSGLSGKAVIYDRVGDMHIYTDPYGYGSSTSLEKIQHVGGSYHLYQYLNPGSKLSHVWYWSANSSSFIRVWVYSAWATDGPSAVTEYVATANVTTTTFVSSQWAARKKTTFQWHASGYQDSNAGDLVGIDEETYLSNGVDTSLRRTAFKYWTGGPPFRMLRAIIGPDSYRDFVVTEPGIAPGVSSTAVFTASLSALRGEAGGYSKNYVDQELEYTNSLRLWKRTVRNLAGTCGCAGSSPGVFIYTYWTAQGSPALDAPKVQVKVDRELSGGGQETYAYYTYNIYGKRLVEATVDPANSTRMRVREWQYHPTTGMLLTVIHPSAIQGFDPALHDTTINQTDGLVYWYTYEGGTEYVSAIHFSKGFTGPLTQLWSFTYNLAIDGNRRRYFLATKTLYIDDTPPNPPTTAIWTYDQLTFHTSDALAIKKQRTTLPPVSTAQNGPGTSAYEWEYFDPLGRRTWFKDAAGAVSKTDYHPYFNAVTSEIVDVNTSTNPPPGGDTDFNQTYVRSTSWPNGGSPLNITTTYQYDSVGRLRVKTEPNGRTSRYLYTRLSKGEDVSLAFPHLTTGGGAVGALNIIVSYQGGRVRDSAEAGLASAVHANDASSSDPNYWANIWNGAAADTVAALTNGGVDRGTVLSHSDSVYTGSHVTESRRYINPEDPSPGSPPTYANVLRTKFAYDARGNRVRVEDPGDANLAGTITAYAYDFAGRLISTKVGTNDAQGTSNMEEVEARAYDGGAIGGDASTGDGKLTTLVERVDESSNDRSTSYSYDYAQEGRLDKTTSATSVIEVQSYNRAGWMVSTKTYGGSVSEGTLRAFSKSLFDSRGNVYESQVLAVEPDSNIDPDPPPGSHNETTGFIKTRYWRNVRGDVVKVEENGGILKKSQFDGAGRLARSTLSWDTTDTTYLSSTDLTLSGDTVVAQAETLYDASGNPIIEKTLEREPAYGATGLLSHGVASQARGNYMAIWYDIEDRETHRSNYGNNNNVNLTTRPGIPTQSDANQLLAKTTYTPDGDVATRTDPEGIETSFTFDALGRLTDKVENSNGSDSWADRWTQYTYIPAGQIKEIKAMSAGDPPGAQVQVTTYIYNGPASKSAGSKLASNRLVYQIDYPADTAGSEVETLLHNRQGELIKKTDIAGNVHQYTYRLDGSLESDQVTTLTVPFQCSPLPCDNILSIWHGYDDIGRLKSVTSRKGTSEGSSAANGVLIVYDKYGQVRDLHQDINAAATTSSPKVRYTYSYPNQSVGSLPGLRLASSLYPNSLQIDQTYTTGTTDYYFSRTSGKAASGGPTLFTNTYLGAGQVVKKNHPTPQIDWTVTLDRFARISTLKATYLPYNYNHNSYEYGYNFNSQVTYRKELTTTGQSEQAIYNRLSMLTEFRRGVHNANGTVQTPAPYHVQWTSVGPVSPDHSGHWRRYWRLHESVTPYTRASNKSNELTAINTPSSGTINLSYDANGNTAAYGTNAVYKYDAWNRLTEIRDGQGNVVAAFSYNGLHQKIKKDEIGTTNDRVYYYGAGYQVLQEYDGSATTAKHSYVWGTQYIDELIARRTESGGAWEYYVQDANFNVTTRINATGSVIYRYVYDAHGEPTQLSSAWTTQSAITEDLTLFTGRDYQNQTGSYDYRSRFYAPGLGRFSQPDGARNWFTPSNFGNRYGYVGLDPIGSVDPFGFDKTKTGYTGQKDITSGGKTFRKEYVRINRCLCYIHLYIIDRVGSHRLIATEKYDCSDAQRQLAEVEIDKKMKPHQLAEGIEPAEKYTEGCQLATGCTGTGRVLEGVATGVQNPGQAVADAALGLASKGRTSRAARRDAMRQNNTPTSRPTTSQTGSGGCRQTTVEGSDGKPRVQTQHPADARHPRPHWHDAKPKIDPATGKELRNQHGQIKEKAAGRSTSEYDG